MKWISVLDDLPLDGVPVLVATNISVKMVQDAQEDQHGWYEDDIEENWNPQAIIDSYYMGEWLRTSISDFSSFGIAVTYWMPLPKFPNLTKEAKK